MADDVRLIVTADGSGAVGEFGKVAGQIEGRMASLANTIKKHWLEIGAAYLTVSKGWDFAEQAAKYQQTLGAFQSMVKTMGRDAEEEFAKIRRASAGLIDNQALLEASNRALAFGIEIEKLPQLMEISRASAREMGITVSQAFGDIVTGIGRASPLILDNLGLTLKIGEANEAYAKSLNKTVEQLTAAERKQAILNATLEAGTEALKRQNIEQATALERIQRFEVFMSNLMLGLKGAGLLVLDIAGFIATDLHWAIGGLFALIEKGLNVLGIGGDELQRKFYALTNDIIQARKDIVTDFNMIIGKAGDLSGAVGKLNDEIDEQVDALEDLSEVQKMNIEYQEQWYELMETDRLDRLTISSEKFRQAIAGIVAEVRDGSIIILAAWDALQKAADEIVASIRDIPAAAKTMAEEVADYFDRIQLDAVDTAAAIEGGIEDGLKTGFKEGLDDILDYFETWLARIAATALAHPIIVPIQTVMNQVGAGMTGATSLPGAIGAAGLSYMLSGGNLVSTAGGLAGYAGSGLLASGLGAVVPSATWAALGPAVSSMIFSAVPIIGTILGAGIGSLVSKLLGGHKKYPSLKVIYGGPTGSEGLVSKELDKAWGLEGSNVEAGEWAARVSSFKEGVEETRGQLIAYFEGIRGNITALSDSLGVEFENLDKFFESQKVQIKNKEQLAEKINQLGTEYVEFATGIDFTQFQIEGEDISQTVTRVVTGLQELTRMEEELQAVRLQHINDLETAIRQTTLEMDSFLVGMQSKIDSLTGGSLAVGAASGAMRRRLAEYQASPGLGALQDYVASIDTWLSLTVSSIEETYSRQRQAIEDSLGAVDDQVAAMQSQIEAARQWREVAVGLSATIASITGSNLNPYGTGSQLDALRRAFFSAGPEAAGGAAQAYLQAALEKYQFPSLAYRGIYDEVVGRLQGLQRGALAKASEEGELMREMASLQEEATSYQERLLGLDEAMQTEIQAANLTAARYYEWAQGEGMRLYQSSIDGLKSDLVTAISDKSVEVYMTDLQRGTNERLEKIADILLQQLGKAMQETAKKEIVNSLTKGEGEKLVRRIARQEA